MKFLLIPGNNSLSHVAKCAALEAALSRRGHRVLIAVARHYRRFLQDLSLSHTIISDIQEADGGALPAVEWFRSTEFLIRCLQAEIELLKSFKPDRVIGVFRFTTWVSTAFLDIPYGAISCGCMMPDAGEVLGFVPGEEKQVDQAFYLDNFFRFAAKKMSIVMDKYGVEPVGDIRDLLVGDRTFLWDFPQFMPLKAIEGRTHVGPLTWSQWPDVCVAPDPFIETDQALALVSLGTRPASRKVVLKVVRCLLACGYNVMIACGGNGNLMDILEDHPRVKCWRFAPLEKILRKTDLMVCHGGQMTIFEALTHRVPVLVIPSQPEQAHNGLCVERIGCGRRLTPSVAFRGDTKIFEDAFTAQPDATIIEMIEQIRSDSGMARMLLQAQQQLQNYDAPNVIAEQMERI